MWVITRQDAGGSCVASLSIPTHILRSLTAAVLAASVVYRAAAGALAADKRQWELVICADPLSLPFSSTE